MSNFDSAEIGHFDSLAASWWDPKGEMGPLHSLNPPRVRFIEQCCGKLEGKKAIDVGCGGGLLSESLARLGASVTGIDMAAQALAVANDHARQSGLSIDYQESTAEAMAQIKEGQFDLVCCLEMLEHVPDPESVVQACARLVRPGGDVVFSTINRNPKSFALAIVGAEYIAGLIPKGTHQYAKLIRPSELVEACRAAGLHASKLRGLRYNPLLRSASLSDDLDVNYLIHCTRPAE